MTEGDTMTWTTYHNRGAILREVTAAADARRDGLLPLDVPGATEVFDGELDLLGALQLRWHTRLAGEIERQLMEQPMDLEAGVVRAWHLTAQAMPGVRAIIDHYRAEPLDDAMATAMAVSQRKEHLLLAVMAGRGGPHDDLAVPVGARIEARARETYRPATPAGARSRGGLLDRLRAAIAA